MGELGRQPGSRLTFDLGRDADGSPLVRLGGELDMTNADQLASEVAPVIAQAPRRLVVDVSDLAFADSSAIALMVKWAKEVPQVEIREPSQLLRRVIVRMGLADRLDVRP